MTFHSLVRYTPYVRYVWRLRIVVPVSQRTFKWPHCTEPCIVQHDNNTVTIIFGQTAAQKPPILQLGAVLVPLNLPFNRQDTQKKMSDEDDFVQKARAGFEDLCRALNMDEEAGSEAWKTYENISRNFTLEVNTSVNVFHEFLCRR